MSSGKTGMVSAQRVDRVKEHVFPIAVLFAASRNERSSCLQEFHIRPLMSPFFLSQEAWLTCAIGTMDKLDLFCPDANHVCISNRRMGGSNEKAAEAVLTSATSRETMGDTRRGKQRQETRGNLRDQKSSRDLSPRSDSKATRAETSARPSRGKQTQPLGRHVKKALTPQRTETK